MAVLRPIPGKGPISVGDVARMRERQRELEVPEAYEWVVETSPSLAEATVGAELEISLHPLLSATAQSFAHRGSTG